MLVVVALWYLYFQEDARVQMVKLVNVCTLNAREAGFATSRSSTVRRVIGDSVFIYLIYRGLSDYITYIRSGS